MSGTFVIRTVQSHITNCRWVAVPHPLRRAVSSTFRTPCRDLRCTADRQETTLQWLAPLASVPPTHSRQSRLCSWAGCELRNSLTERNRSSCPFAPTDLRARDFVGQLVTIRARPIAIHPRRRSQAGDRGREGLRRIVRRSRLCAAAERGRHGEDRRSCGAALARNDPVPRNAVLAVVGDVQLAEVERIVVDHFRRMVG